jgi:hypothetical protein
MNAGFSFLDDIKASAPANRLAVLPVSVVEVAASGDAGIRGESNHDSQSSRNGFSPFPFEAAELSASLFLRDCKQVVDPFSGWGERGEAMGRHAIKYTGFDLSPVAIDNAMRVYGVKNTLTDSRTVDVPEHDGLFTCPPYWNLEDYGNGGIDQAKQWREFLRDYALILERFSKRCAKGTYCIMTGDWRENGKYYDLTYQTEKIMDALGFEPFDKVVVSRLGISKVKIMLPQAKRLGYTVKVHETISVFKR